MISDKFTYGLELEVQDIDITIMPDEYLGSWNAIEYGIVNSDGTTNRCNNKGGEFNLKPTDSIKGQIELLKKFKETYPLASAGYRDVTHIHIAIPGLKDDIDALLKFFVYVEDNMDFILKYLCPPFPEPKREDYPTNPDFKRAKWFYYRKSSWFRHRVPQDRVQEILKATTPNEFYVKHFWFNEDYGKYEKLANIKRAAINFMSIFYHGTVEFRFFTATVNLLEIEDFYEFCDQVTRAALWDHSMTIEKIWNSREWKIPPFPPMSQWLEKSYLTRHRVNRKALNKHFYNTKKNYPDYYDEVIGARWKERFHDF